jgi:hypothetical protein
MNKEFVKYEQALALKELGFDEPCLFHTLKGEINFYRTSQDYFFKNTKNSIGVSVILYQQAFKWFREKHGLYTEIFVDDDKTFGFLISSFIEEGRVDKPIHRGFSTYEEVESACLSKLIEIVNDIRRNS